MRISDWSSDVCSSDLLGERLHISAPAVHERVKKLKKSGAIRGTVARLDGEAVGRPLSAFIHIDTEGRSEEHTIELQSLMRLSYAVFCLKKIISINSSVFDNIPPIRHPQS